MPSRTTAPGRSIALAVLLTVGVLAIGWAYLQVYNARHRPHVLASDPAGAFFGPRDIAAPLLLIVPFYDSLGQKHAHLLMLGLLVGLVLVGPWLPGLLRRVPLPRRPVWRVLLGFGLGALLLTRPGLWYCPVWVHALCLLAAGMLIAATTWPTGWLNRLLGLACPGLLLLAIGPGLLGRYDLSGLGWESVVFMQEHYVTVAGQGDRLAAGQVLFEEVMPYYGALLPSLVGMYQRWIAPLELGGYVAVIRALQAAFLIIAGWLYYRFGQRNWACCLAALLLAVPVYHFNQPGMLTPNQTAWRTIGFPLGLLGLFLLRHAPLGRLAFGLGIVAGLVLLLNFETGVAVVAGLLTYVYFRHRPQSLSEAGALVPRFGLRFAAGLALFFASFATLYWLLLGVWPLRQVHLLAAYTFSWQSALIGGLPFDGDPFAVVVFAHAAFVLLRCALGRSRPHGWYGSFLAAVAAILLVWFAYYAHRVHRMNLTSYFFLYGFLLIDCLRSLAASLRRGEVGLLALTQAAVLAVVVAPGVYRTGAEYAEAYWQGIKVAIRGPVDRDAVLVSGVWMSRPCGEELLERARLARELERSGETVLLSADYFLIAQMADLYHRPPFGSLFMEAMTKRQYRRRMQQLVAAQAEVLLFDAPGSQAAASTPARTFYDQVKKDLAWAYRKDRIVGGWEVWTRRAGGVEEASDE